MAKVTSIEAMLLKTQLRWAGHVSRMEDHRLSKIDLYYNTGHRDKGTPQKIYKVNRMNWRRTCTVYQATTSFKATRIDRRSGPVDVLDRHTGFESCAAVSHGQLFSQCFQLTQLYERNSRNPSFSKFALSPSVAWNEYCTGYYKYPSCEFG